MYSVTQEIYRGCVLCCCLVQLDYPNPSRLLPWHRGCQPCVKLIFRTRVRILCRNCYFKSTCLIPPLHRCLRPLCLPQATIKLTRSPLDAQRRQHGCLDRSKVVTMMFHNRHGRYGRHQVLNVFKTVVGGSPRRLVAPGSLK